MAQKQCITPFRCLMTHTHSILRDGTRLHRSALSTHCVYQIQYPPVRQNAFIATRNFRPTRSQQTRLSQTPASPIPLITRPQTRPFTSSPPSRHGDLTPPKPGEERHVTFIDKEGHEHQFEVADGDNLLDIAQANDLEMEGACGGSCACSTCHVIVQDDEFYDKIEEPSDDENDMLDLAFGLTETSRLGCQVQMSKELDGLVVG